jgi:hypothetical protein
MKYVMTHIQRNKQKNLTETGQVMQSILKTILNQCHVYTSKKHALRFSNASVFLKATKTVDWNKVMILQSQAYMWKSVTEPKYREDTQFISTLVTTVLV